MRKFIAAVLCMTIAAASALSVSADTSTESNKIVTYSWYLEPTIAADDMTVLYNYQGSYDKDNSLYFYDTIDRMHLSEYTPFEVDGKWGLIDYNGNIALTPQYDKLATSADIDEYVGLEKKVVGDYTVYTNETTLYESGGTFKARDFYDSMLGTNGKLQRAFYWLSDEEKAYVGGIQSYAGEYDMGNLTFCAQLGVKQDMGAVYVTNAGESIINPDNPDVVLVSKGKRVGDEYYTDGGCFSDGLIAMCKDGMWGYVNKRGETVIPFELDSSSTIDYSYSIDGKSREIAYEASNGYVATRMADMSALYDTSGNRIIKYGLFRKILPVFSNGTDKLAWVKKGDKWGVIKIVETIRFRKGDANRDNYITAKDSLLVLRKAIGLVTLDEEQFALADIDEDGRVTGRDSLYILRFTIGYNVKGIGSY